MKRVNFVVFVAMMGFLSGCVTYPSYVKRYSCTNDEKKKLGQLVIDCISSLQKQVQKDAEEVVSLCEGAALKATCKAEKYFERVSLPFFGKTSEIPCSKAESAYVGYICDKP